MKQRAKRKQIQRMVFKRALRPFIDELMVSLYEVMEIINKRSEEVLNALQKLSDISQEMENDVCKSCGKCYKEHIYLDGVIICGFSILKQKD
jgi:hypothetical protein